MAVRTRSPKATSAQRTGAVTIADIAAAAGVSKMTVSRVLSAPWTVREDTRDRVTKLIADLHYVPNRSARSLSGATQLRFGLLYNLPRSSYMVDFLLGAIDQASLLDIQLVSRGCRLDDDAADMLVGIADAGVDAIILTPPLCDSPPLLAIAAGLDVPVVLVSTDAQVSGLSTIFIDEQEASREMTRHLIALGHRRIGFIMGEPVLTATHVRRAGFEAALAEAAIAVDPELIAAGLFTYRSGLEAADRLLRLDPPPTAIFASNDDMAAATVMTAHRLGYDVPGQITVCGFDDSWIATTVFPELTTIRQPIPAMAREAVTILAEAVQARKAGKAFTRRHRAPHELIVRQSSGPRPPGVAEGGGD